MAGHPGWGPSHPQPKVQLLILERSFYPQEHVREAEQLQVLQRRHETTAARRQRELVASRPWQLPPEAKAEQLLEVGEQLRR